MPGDEEFPCTGPLSAPKKCTPALRDKPMEGKLGTIAEKEGSEAAHATPWWPTQGDIRKLQPSRTIRTWRVNLHFCPEL